MMRCVTAMTLALFLTANPARAQGTLPAPSHGVEEREHGGNAIRPNVWLNVGAYGKYIWHGLAINRDPVLQADIGISLYGFALSVWGNMDLTDRNSPQWAGQFTEVDWTLSYTHAWGPFSLAGGVMSYDYPNTGAASTHEVFVEAALELPLTGPLNVITLKPGVAVYYDFDDAKDALFASPYIEGTVELPAMPLPLYPESIQCKAYTGFCNRKWNDYYTGVDTSAAFMGGLDIAFPCKIRGVDALTLSPGVNLSTIWHRASRDRLHSKDNVVWVFNVGLEF